MMSNDRTSANIENESIVIQVVRGQKPWTVLQSVGINITFKNELCQVEGKGSMVVTPTIEDFTLGFIRLRSDPMALKLWAAVMLAASAVIDFAEIEKHPSGDAFVEILWALAAGEPITDKAVNLIEKLSKAY